MARMEQIAKKGRRIGRGAGGGGISRFLPPLEETPHRVITEKNMR